MSVFSQSESDATAATEETTSVSETGADEESEVDMAASDTEPEAAELAATATPVATPQSTSLNDNYKREKLPNDDVFGDFVVGPGRVELELAPGQSRTVEIVISNRMGEAKVFSFENEDAVGSETGDQVVVLLGDDEGPYTIRDYISVPYSRFELNHAERARIPVTISLPPDAEPGGRYGSFLVSIVSNPNEQAVAGGAAPASVIVSRIGVLFFITTPGLVDREGVMQKFSTMSDQRFYAAGPIDMNIVFENTGSVHLNPYGEVRIANFFGEEVGFVELEPWFVMPQSLRNRQVTWDREFLIGRYTATAYINRGYDDVVDEQSYTFWVIPWKLITVVFAGFFVFFLLLRLVFSQFEFKRKR